MFFKTSRIFFVVSVVSFGCSSGPAPVAPVVTHQSLTTEPSASTRPIDFVATLPSIQISRTELDDLLYEAYGLRALYDVVELKLAKAMLAEKHIALEPADVQRERQSILAKICGDAPQSSYEDLFNQFLQQQHLSRAEFDVKVVQTQACLRKMVEPMIRGKLPDVAVHKAFEQLYGAKRIIADITLQNIRDATIARQRLANESFEKVCREMSTDENTRGDGGIWPPFSAQAPRQQVPQVIKDEAFRMDVGQVSDILQADTNCHIIKLLEKVEPKIVKFEDVKDDVRKQLEDQLTEAAMKSQRNVLTAFAQQHMLILDPVLKGRWDQLVQQQQGTVHDRDSALKQMNDARVRTSTAPTTAP